MFINPGDVEEDGSSAHIFYYESYGRIKFDKQDTDPKFSLGYRFLNVSVDSSRADLDGAYNDVAVVGALQLGEAGDNDQWRVGLIAGAGSANDDHWQHGDSYYGLGAVNFSRDLSQSEQLHLGISYDGNRAFMPDVPLPYVSYVNAENKNFIYIIGLPVSSVTWRPCEKLELNMRYLAPVGFGAGASYFVTHRLAIFGEYDRSTGAFHEHDATRDNQRLFYELSTLTTGVKYHHDLADVRVGIGYAFDQEFSRGFDVRDTTTFASPTDEVLFFFTVSGTF